MSAASALLPGCALRWTDCNAGGVSLFRVPPADTLRYVVLSRPTWLASDDRSWLGRSALVMKHGQGAVLRPGSVNLPMPATTVTATVEPRPPVAHRVAVQGTLDILSAAHGSCRIIPAAALRPSIVRHTSDSRALSFMATLQPRRPGLTPRPATAT